MESMIIGFLLAVAAIIFAIWKFGDHTSDEKIDRELEEIEKEPEVPERPKYTTKIVRDSDYPKYTTRIDGSTHD